MAGKCCLMKIQSMAEKELKRNKQNIQVWDEKYSGQINQDLETKTNVLHQSFQMSSMVQFLPSVLWVDTAVCDTIDGIMSSEEHSEKHLKVNNLYISSYMWLSFQKQIKKHDLL